MGFPGRLAVLGSAVRIRYAPLTWFDRTRFLHFYYASIKQPPLPERACSGSGGFVCSGLIRVLDLLQHVGQGGKVAFQLAGGVQWDVLRQRGFVLLTAEFRRDLIKGQLM